MNKRIPKERKHYKVWVEIEKFDPKIGDYVSLTQNGEAWPVLAGTFKTLKRARETAEQLAYDAIDELEE